VQIIKYKNGYTGIRKILAKLCVTTAVRLEGSKMGGIKINTNDADITLQNHATTGHCIHGRKNAERQARYN
jgi:hypothetical protein